MRNFFMGEGDTAGRLFLKKAVGMVNARAEVPEFAFLAVGIACLAATASMPDEPVGEESPLLLRAELHEILLHLHGITI
jgi:hypothetical protein